LGFGLWALGFEFLALGFGLWALGFGLWAVDFGVQGHCMPAVLYTEEKDAAPIGVHIDLSICINSKRNTKIPIPLSA
jgi:hypothetical protein